MVKPENKKHHDVVEVKEVDADALIDKLIEDTGANTIEIKKIEGPIKNAIIDIIPGKKVKVEGKGDVIFSISQKLSDGKIAVLGPEGLILNVKPGQLKDIK